MKTELKVGIFALLVIIILSYMTFKISGLGVAWKRGNRLTVVFDNISGLDEKSKVKVAGVNAGVVENIRLKEGRAESTLLISPDIKIYNDAKASLRVSGLLGDKYLAVTPGTSGNTLLKDGDSITNTEEPIDIDELASKLTSAASGISDLSDNLKGIFGDDEKASFRETLRNLKTITKNLNAILEEDRRPLHNTLVQLDDFSRSLRDKGPGLIEDLSKAAKDLREVVEENRYAVKDSIENIKKASVSVGNIAQKMDAGEGTIGKLLKDDKLYNSVSNVAGGLGKTFDIVDRMKTYFDFRSEYLTKDGDWKGYFNLTLEPRKDKYYILGVVSDPLGTSEITDRTVNGVTTREEEVRRKFEFSAQFAKRFEDLALRVGMLENTFGFGADYFMANDRAKVSINAWDFSAEEPRAQRAHVKAGVDYRIFKHVFVSGGIDNILNSNRMGIFIGGGIEFEDEDFKYIFGTAPRMPSR
ncbi:MAG: MCE family protein [Nitrospirae bacterium]|nr:MCE family protein [Nitrospirota bacterium]